MKHSFNYFIDEYVLCGSRNERITLLQQAQEELSKAEFSAFLSYCENYNQQNP